jgi:hypothetical protein
LDKINTGEIVDDNSKSLDITISLYEGTNKEATKYLKLENLFKHREADKYLLIDFYNETILGYNEQSVEFGSANPDVYNHYMDGDFFVIKPQEEECYIKISLDNDAVSLDDL